MKVGVKARQQIMLCRVSAAMLERHEMQTSMINLTQCITWCTSTSYCYSINYELTNNTCTLNNATDLDNSEDFKAGLAKSYLHFTSRECV